MFVVQEKKYIENDPCIRTIMWMASQPANLILRCFTTRDPLVLIKAFNTFVRPLLEYATDVWSPSAKMSIRKLSSRGSLSVYMVWATKAMLLD